MFLCWCFTKFPYSSILPLDTKEIIFLSKLSDIFSPLKPPVGYTQTEKQKEITEIYPKSAQLKYFCLGTHTFQSMSSSLDKREHGQSVNVSVIVPVIVAIIVVISVIVAAVVYVHRKKQNRT